MSKLKLFNAKLALKHPDKLMPFLTLFFDLRVASWQEWWHLPIWEEAICLYSLHQEL